NKVMIGKLDSVVAAGFYQQADSIVKIIVAVVTSLGTVLMPRVSNLFATNQMTKIKQYVHKSMDFSLFLSLPVMAGLSSISAYFVPWFFGSGYNKVIVLIDIESITLILIAISNVLGMQFLVPTRRTREFTLSISIGAIINIALNPLAIVYWGAVGAMFVTVIAELVVVLVQVFVLRHEISFISLFKQSWKYCVCTIIMTLVIVTLNYYMNSSYSNWLIIAVDVILGSLIYIIGNSLLRTNMFLECLRFIKKG
ncbi:polysaccharide biosynthesis protein, partial [Leuconostoc mesenteroides]